MIFFNVQQVREFLLKNGFVYTLRKSRRIGNDLAVYGSYYKQTKIGKCKIQLEATYPIGSEIDLSSEHVKYSSFKSAEEWFNLAKKLCKGELPYLYKVTLI